MQNYLKQTKELATAFINKIFEKEIIILEEYFRCEYRSFNYLVTWSLVLVFGETNNLYFFGNINTNLFLSQFLVKVRPQAQWKWSRWQVFQETFACLVNLRVFLNTSLLTSQINEFVNLFEALLFLHISSFTQNFLSYATSFSSKDSKYFLHWKRHPLIPLFFIMF